MWEGAPTAELMTSSSGPARSEVDEATVATLRAKVVVVGEPRPPPPAPGEQLQRELEVT